MSNYYNKLKKNKVEESDKNKEIIKIMDLANTGLEKF